MHTGDWKKATFLEMDLRDISIILETVNKFIKVVYWGVGVANLGQERTAKGQNQATTKNLRRMGDVRYQLFLYLCFNGKIFWAMIYDYSAKPESYHKYEIFNVSTHEHINHLSSIYQERKDAWSPKKTLYLNVTPLILIFEP